MAKAFAFLFYPGEYLRDTQCLSEKSQVAYDRIMCEHMRNICISHAQLKFFTKRLNNDELEELSMVLTEVSGGFQITWVVDSIIKRRDYSESRRNNRVNKSSDDYNNISESYDDHMVIVKEKEGLNNPLDQENNKGVDFEIFWNLYDKKVGLKEKVQKKWSALKLQEQETAIAYIPNYKIAQPEKKFRKDPATFLNNKSWLDELILPSQPQSKFQSLVTVNQQIKNPYESANNQNISID